MYKLIFALLFLLVTITGGCSNEGEEKSDKKIQTTQFSEESGRDGYVINKLSEGFLFAPTWQEDLIDKYDEKNLGMVYPNSISVSVSQINFSLEQLEKGQKIRIWYDQIIETNPPTVNALKVELIE